MVKNHAANQSRTQRVIQSGFLMAWQEKHSGRRLGYLNRVSITSSATERLQVSVLFTAHAHSFHINDCLNVLNSHFIHLCVLYSFLVLWVPLLGSARRQKQPEIRQIT